MSRVNGGQFGSRSPRLGVLEVNGCYKWMGDVSYTAKHLLLLPKEH